MNLIISIYFLFPQKMRKEKNEKQIKSERNFFDQSRQGVPVSLSQYPTEIGGERIYTTKGQWRGDISPLRSDEKRYIPPMTEEKRYIPLRPEKRYPKRR